jgi:single-strand DNA-binding protein
MASLNRWDGIGNVGSQETRYMPDGKPVVTMSLACNDNYKNKEGEKVERTEWIRIIFFGKLAEIVDQYVEKGKQLYVSGRMTTREWEDKEGIKRYTTEIIGQDMKMLGSKNASGNRPPAYGEAEPPAQKNQAPKGSGFEDMDDMDIPF